MKKKVFLLTIAFLTVVALVLSANTVNFARADAILSDNFQSGTLSAWNLYQSPSIAINSQVTNNGEPYSVEVTIAPGQDRNIAYQALPSVPNPIHIREYVYISSISTMPTDGDYFQVGGFSSAGGPNYGDGELIVTNFGGTLYWGIYYRHAIGDYNPSGFNYQISTSNTTGTAVPVTVGWTCIELEQKTGDYGVANGYEKLYVNGQLIVNAQNVMNGDRSPVNAVIGGSQYVTSLTGGSLKYYLTDVIVSSDYIGLNQNTLRLFTNAGTVTPSNGSSYAQGQQVTIEAIAPTPGPGERYVFNGWVGSGIGSYSGLNNPATVTMNSQISETAVWEHQYQLTIVSPQGTVVGNNTWYDVNTTATATIVNGTVAGSTGTRYVFTTWSGAATGTGLTSGNILMTGPKTAIANWTTQYYLTTTTAHGVVTGSGWYNAGTTATATLDSLTSPGTTGTQYAFTNWGTDATGIALTSNAITMNAPKTAITTWQTQYNLTVNQVGVGSDFTANLITVNGNPYNAAGYSAWVNANSANTFSYIPQAIVSDTTTKYLLTGVTGNTTATSVTATGPITVTATYSTQYYLTVASQYDSPSPTSRWYDKDTSVSAFVSSPASGYSCSGWTGTGSVPATGATSAVTFTITAPSTLTWNWALPTTATPTPSPTTNPTSTPSPTTKPSVSPSPTQTTAPTITPTQQATTTPPPQTAVGVNPAIYAAVAAIIAIVIASILLVLRRRKK